MACREAKSVLKSWELKIQKPTAQAKTLGLGKNSQNELHTSMRDEKLKFPRMSEKKMGIFQDLLCGSGIALSNPNGK